jgi:site-specific recombinase XerC
MRDLRRYMGILGADVKEPLGEPWRLGKRPLRAPALQVAASCLKGFYSYLGVAGQISTELAASLSANTRLPTKADRNRSLIGHALTSLPTNELAPKKVRRRHPKMLPDGAREALLEAATTARDRMTITWLFDGGDGLERALTAMGLLDEALALDLRRPQDYFHRLWRTAFRPGDLTDNPDNKPEALDESA